MKANEISEGNPNMNELRFDGRVAIVTGAGNGLGRSHALALAQRGAKVVVNDLGASVGGVGTDPSAAGKVVAEITAAGGTAVANHESVATAEGAASIVSSALAAFGRVDIVINNAGIVAFAPVADVSIEDYKRHLDVHLVGSFNVTRAAWPHLVEQGYGRVVMTTSSGILGVPTLVSYSSAKAGLVGLGRSLARAGAPHDIRVNMAAPFASTRMWEEGVTASHDNGVPHSSPDEAAKLICLLSHEACPVSGEIIRSACGRISRVFLAETAGEFASSPEEILAKWDGICDEQGYVVPVDSADINGRAIAIALDFYAAVGQA